MPERDRPQRRNYWDVPDGQRRGDRFRTSGPGHPSTGERPDPARHDTPAPGTGRSLRVDGRPLTQQQGEQYWYDGDHDHYGYDDTYDAGDDPYDAGHDSHGEHAETTGNVLYDQELTNPEGIPSPVPRSGPPDAGPREPAYPAPGPSGDGAYRRGPRHTVPGEERRGYGIHGGTAPRATNPKLIRAGALAMAVLVVAASLAWIAFKPRNRVARAVNYQGRSVVGMPEADVKAMVKAQHDALAKSHIQVQIEGQQPTVIDASSAGVSIDQEATVRSIMSAHQGLGGFLASLFSTAELKPVVAVDQAQVLDLSGSLLPDEEGKKKPSGNNDAKTSDAVSQATEAHIEIDDKSNKLVGVAGRPGTGISPEKLSHELQVGAEKNQDPGTGFTVGVKPEHLTPRFTKADADKLAADGERLIQTPLPVKAGETAAEIPTNALRPLLTSRAAPDGLRLVVNGDKAQDAAAKALQGAGNGATEATFKIVNGAPNFVPGKPGTKCCADDSGNRVAQAVVQRPQGPVVLGLRTVNPAFDESNVGQLGIKEKISEFTTKHNPPKGKDRVTNIHLIADLIKGQVVLPGQTFSVNKFVGPRTEEKGFVKDHSIDDGRLVDTVGGGVSQFATTLFNAAWEGGLDIPVYQSHSIYFPRYPKGRDATLSYPNVDLQVKNPTTYGVMIWADYTDTSLTVSLWSTRYFPKVDAPQFDKGGGTETPYLVACTQVQVKRTVTLPDGTTRIDSTKTTYQQKEGILCNGDQSAVKDENGNVIQEAKPYKPGDPLPPGITAPKPTTTTTKPGATTVPGATTTTSTTKPGAPTTAKPKRP